MVGRRRRLVLRVRRLGRGHSSIVDDTAVSARAVVRPVRSHTVWRRVGPVGGARRWRGSRGSGTAPVGVHDASVAQGRALRSRVRRRTLRVLMSARSGRHATAREPAPAGIGVRLLADLGLLRRAGLALRRGRGSTERFSAFVRVRGLRRRVDVGEPASPILTSACRGRRRASRGGLLRRSSPLRSNRAGGTSGLIRLGMHVRRLGRWGRATVAAAGAQELKAGLNVRVPLVKLRRPLICVEGIGDLVVARLVLGVRSASGSREECGHVGLPGFQDHTRPQKCTGSA